MNCIEPQKPRSGGLDTLRTAAIALVFMNHYMAFISRERTFGWGSDIGWVGVDLFFVLSGYLIANQLFSGIARGEQISAGAFYARRAFRTLPAYWVVLTLYFLFPVGMGSPGPLPPLWKFLTFTQNFNLHPGTGFSHAWSLCVEEQFYLILPIVLAVGASLSLGRSQGWTLLLALLAIGVGARTLLWFDHRSFVGGFYPNIYYATLCRFDEFLPGIAIAMLKSFHRPTWERITRHGQATLIAAALCVGVLLYCMDNFFEIDGYGHTFFLTAAGYPLLAMSFGLLVVAALSPNSWLSRIRIPGVHHIALWSYSIYLSHKGIGAVVARLLAPYSVPHWALAVAVALASILAGALLYRLIEAPFMALRDRLIPTNFASGKARSAAGTLPAA